MKILTISVSTFLLLSGGLFAQSSSVSRQIPPGSIDGSQTPNLIPDVVACRFIFLSLQLPPVPVEADMTKQNRKLQRIGLATMDLVTVKAVLAQFTTQYSDWLALARANRASASSRVALESQAQTIVQQTYDVLISELTSDGAVRFAKFVQTEKARMVVHP